MVKARFKVLQELMPTDWVNTMSTWLDANQSLLERGGDDEGNQRFNWEITNLEQHCPHLAPFRKALVKALPRGLKPCGVEPFELQNIDIVYTLYHHAAMFHWHTDANGPTSEPVLTRRVTFCYYLHSLPKMFKGGQLEFIDGTLLEPDHNSLTLFEPLQTHRVRPVECWSAEFMHGRMCLMGWYHSSATDAPPE